VDITYQLAAEEAFVAEKGIWVTLARRAQDLWLVAMAPVDPVAQTPMQWTEARSGEAFLVPLFPYIIAPDAAGQFLFGCGLGMQLLSDSDTARARLKHVSPKQLHVIAAPGASDPDQATRILAGFAFRYAT